MSESLFPSGPWVGFYNYRAGGQRHRMDLQLTFVDGRMSGEGSDDVGRFFLNGHYDRENRECYWTKTYVGQHDVFYRGFRENKGIWGVWEIGTAHRGGFHIWPRSEGEVDSLTESVAQSEPVDAIAPQVSEATSPLKSNN